MLDPHEVTRIHVNNLGLYQVWHGAIDWYNFDHASKRYHNIQHALKVVDAVYYIKDEPSVALMMAAKWHDAVYVPLAGTDANERCSAAALGVCYHRLGIDKTPESDKVIADAQKLIMRTHVGVHLTDHRVDPESDQAVLNDADLSSLAEAESTFFVNQINIIKENFGTPHDNIKDSAAFLGKFLTCREYIYHTKNARELWEDKAKENIVNFIRMAESYK